MVSAATATAVIAQTGGGFDLSFSSVDGGGTTSTGDSFSLTGVAGQADAVTSTGGNFALGGGFFGVIEPTPAPTSIASAEPPEEPGEALIALAQTEPASASSRLSFLGKNRPEEAGTELVLVTKSDPDTGADVLISTAVLSAEIAGATLTNAAEQDN